MTDAKFIDGLTAKQPHERAPEYVKATLSINRARLIAWLQAQEGEWVNADLKESREGKLYVQVNTYQRNIQRDSGQHRHTGPTAQTHRNFDDDIGF